MSPGPESVFSNNSQKHLGGVKNQRSPREIIGSPVNLTDSIECKQPKGELREWEELLETILKYAADGL